MIRKAIELHPDEFRYHLAYGNILAEREQFAQAISEYRDALRLAAQTMQTMLLPVRRTMSQVQISFARQLFKEAKYQEALGVYEEIKRFQDILNDSLGTVVAEYPDVLIQIVRTRAKAAAKQPDVNAYRQIGEKHADAICWVNDRLSMSVSAFAEMEAKGYQPRMSFEAAKSDLKFPSVKLAQNWPVRLYPWVLQAELAPKALRLIGKRKEDVLDPTTGKKLSSQPRSGYVHHFENVALRTAEEKLTLTEIPSGKVLWEVDGSWSHDFKSNGKVVVGTVAARRGGGKLQCLDLKTGTSLWEAPGATKFQLDDRYVMLKRTKQGKRASGGGLSLEEAATGDAEAIGYIFQVLDAQTGKVIFERQSSGSHYWRVPVTVGDLVLLTDGFAHIVYAYDIASGKLRWQAKFDSFFARPPLIMDGKVFLYMRRPKLKTIVQYVLDPTTGDTIHETDLQINSIYARPILIGKTLFLHDPVTYELLAVDRYNGGTIGRQSVKAELTEVSRRNVVTLEGMGNSIYYYTWDGLILKFDVEPE